MEVIVTENDERFVLFVVTRFSGSPRTGRIDPPRPSSSRTAGATGELLHIRLPPDSLSARGFEEPVMSSDVPAPVPIPPANDPTPLVVSPLLRWVCTSNPFYIISAALFLFGLRMSFGAA